MSPGLQPPSQGQQPPEPQGPGGGFASPSPEQKNPEAMQLLGLVRNIVSSSRMIAQKVPGASDIVRQINDLAQKIQLKIVQGGPAPEPQAPPQ